LLLGQWRQVEVSHEVRMRFLQDEEASRVQYT
jgi:hypothetical protein